MKVGVGVCIAFVLVVVAACDPDNPTVTIGGTVTGVEGSGLVLSNNGSDDLPISADGTFAFPIPVVIGDPYAVTVVTQPTSPRQTCTVTHGEGRAPSPVPITNIEVSCQTEEFTVGGTVTGLTGKGLVIQNNGTDDLAISADGEFTFPMRIQKGTAFAVTVKQQPLGPSQTCTVSGGTGTVGGKVTTVVVDCSVDRFTVGGTVAGLAGTVMLQNNGADDISISSNGTFAFPTTVPSGMTYNVTVLAQPGTPSQTCVVSTGMGTVTTGNITSVQVVCTTNKFHIGGMVTGLAGSGLVIRDNGGDNLAISHDGTFTFSQPIASGTTYAVTVFTQPVHPSQVCTVTGGTGTVGSSDVTDVLVTCVTSHFTIGGTVSGLAGTGLVLRDNGGDDLAISANGSFTFATPIDSGASYSVTIVQQPTNPTQTCTVSAGTGTVGGSNVTNVVVSCTTNKYTVGGTISGLAGKVVLRNNNANELTLTANGSFTFTTPLASGASFAVTVASQPGTPSQTCTVTNGTGVVTSFDIITVDVTCVTNAFTVGGTVSGLAGTGLVLRDNGGDDLAITANGTFTFATPVASGTTFAVTVASQPDGPSQTCTVTNGSATMGGANVTIVKVTCTVDTFRIGGTVTGLVGTGLVLKNNGTDPITITADGTFFFPFKIASGHTYNVMVYTQPGSPAQTCSVTDGAGTVLDADITSVGITCI